MHDSTPRVSKFTCEFLMCKRFIGEKITEWPQSSPDLNLIENLWSSIVKMKLYKSGKQYKLQSRLIGKQLKLPEIQSAEVKKKKINKINE